AQVVRLAVVVIAAAVSKAKCVAELVHECPRLLRQSATRHLEPSERDDEVVAGKLRTARAAVLVQRVGPDRVPEGESLGGAHVRRRGALRLGAEELALEGVEVGRATRGRGGAAGRE